MSEARQKKGIGCGMFLILVGVGLFAEKMGWIDFGKEWLLPAAFIAIGAGMIFDATWRRR